MLHDQPQKKQYTEWRIYGGFALRSVLVTLILETLNRGSVFSAFRFLTGKTVPFLCNALIIFTTLSISRLFGKRRRFFADLFTIIWLLFGVVNAIVLRYRMTPFSAEDFSMIPSLLRIAKNYLTLPMILMIIAGAVLLVALIVFMWLKVPKVGYEGRFLLVLIKTAVCFLGTAIVIRVSLSAGLLSNEFENLADAYQKYGFSYCFLTSIVDVGIDRPQGYSEEMMQEIAQTIREYSEPADMADASIRPNIIMIQLESFFDPLYLKGFRYSEDPIPCFRRLRDGFPSGFLTVPVVGAGTSNTEFEILTGMSTSYFGAGEYPYNTILKERSVEALPHILSRFGYQSTAIHNNTGTFYNRHIVFSQMGFDTFIPREYMYDLEWTPNNWAKDKVLTDIMMDTLEESGQPDFIYTITVQSHGRYPQERVLSNEERVIRVRREGGSLEMEPLEYYVNEIHEVDRMVEDLTQRLLAFEEPTVLVLFGDHLPALGFSTDDLKNRDLYETEYVIWNNFSLEGEDGKLQAEQLGTHLLDTFGMAEGIISRFHLAYESDAFMDTFSRRRTYRGRYRKDLEAVEYDMLYGEGWIFGEFSGLPGVTTPAEDKGHSGWAGETQTPPGYRASNLKIRYKTISVNDVQTGEEYLNELSGEEKAAYAEAEISIAPDALIARGENFNEYSKIMVDSKPRETVYLRRDALMLEGTPPAAYDMLSVGQFDENFRQLGRCANYIFYPRLGRPAR